MQHQLRTWQYHSDRARSRESTWRAGIAGLQGQMTLSYVWVTAALILVLEMLAMVGLSLLLFLVVAPFVYTLEARQVAQRYALVASLRASTAALDPQSTFQTGQQGTLALPGQVSSSDTASVPYIATQASNTRILAVALLIAPDGSILASSYPHRYPFHLASSSLLPSKGVLISRALLGIESSGQETTLAESSVYAVEPVWNRQLRPIGAVYVQFTNLPTAQNALILAGAGGRLFLIGGLLLLVLLPPISGLFGRLTTRGLVRRIHQLVEATSHLADGDYGQRVSIGHQDEIGQLERHFNRMALQLTESIQQQQTLTEQNARLAERTRLSRDLHDTIKQQVFALATQIGAALSLCDHQPEETRAHLEVASELAYQVRQELTTLIQEWRPSPLGEQGFTQALRKELERWSRHNTIPVDMQLHDVPQLPTAIIEELLRVVQEALSNVARHSQATHVQVSLEREREQIVLTVVDNGRGFDRSAVSSQSMGLQSMQERLEGMNGTFQLQSSIGQGTHIEVFYPYLLHSTSDISEKELHE